MLFYLYKILQRNPSFQKERMTLVLELLLCRHMYRPPAGLRLTHHLMNRLKKKLVITLLVEINGDSLRMIFTGGGVRDIHILGVM